MGKRSFASYLLSVSFIFSSLFLFPSFFPLLFSYIFLNLISNHYSLRNRPLFPPQICIYLHLNPFKQRGNKRKQFNNFLRIMLSCFFFYKARIYFFKLYNEDFRSAGKNTAFWTDICRNVLYWNGTFRRQNSLICFTAFLQWLTLLLKVLAEFLLFQFQKSFGSIYQGLDRTRSLRNSPKKEFM